MLRPAASVVSALSGFGANGRQAVHHVSSSPSEIPYSGFSPVRLQIGDPDATFAAALRRLLIRARSSPGPLVPVGPPAEWRRAGCRRAADPEALGSPAGCAVPPGRRLLWPHPRLWASPADFLRVIRRVFARGPRPRASLLLSACPCLHAAFHTPAVGRAFDCWRFRPC